MSNASRPLEDDERLLEDDARSLEEDAAPVAAISAKPVHLEPSALPQFVPEKALPLGAYDPSLDWKTYKPQPLWSNPDYSLKKGIENLTHPLKEFGQDPGKAVAGAVRATNQAFTLGHADELGSWLENHLLPTTDARPNETPEQRDARTLSEYRGLDAQSHKDVPNIYDAFEMGAGALRDRTLFKALGAAVEGGSKVASLGKEALKRLAVAALEGGAQAHGYANDDEHGLSNFLGGAAVGAGTDLVGQLSPKLLGAVSLASAAMAPDDTSTAKRVGLGLMGGANLTSGPGLLARLVSAAAENKASDIRNEVGQDLVNSAQKEAVKMNRGENQIAKQREQGRKQIFKTLKKQEADTRAAFESEIDAQRAKEDQEYAFNLRDRAERRAAIQPGGGVATAPESLQARAEGRLGNEVNEAIKFLRNNPEGFGGQLPPEAEQGREAILPDYAAKRNASLALMQQGKAARLQEIMRELEAEDAAKKTAGASALAGDTYVPQKRMPIRDIVENRAGLEVPGAAVGKGNLRQRAALYPDISDTQIADPGDLNEALNRKGSVKSIEQTLEDSIGPPKPIDLSAPGPWNLDLPEGALKTSMQDYQASLNRPASERYAQDRDAALAKVLALNPKFEGQMPAELGMKGLVDQKLEQSGPSKAFFASFDKGRGLSASIAAAVRNPGSRVRLYDALNKVFSADRALGDRYGQLLGRIGTSGDIGALTRLIWATNNDPEFADKLEKAYGSDVQQ